MPTTLTSTGITFPDSTTKTTAETYISAGSIGIPSNSSPLIICDFLTTSLKTAKFTVASASSNSGPASIGIAIQASSASNNNIQGYHSRLSGTSVSSAAISISNPTNGLYLINPPTSYTTPNTWDVTLTRSKDTYSTGVYTYILTYTASSSGSNYIIHGQAKFTGNYSTYITDIGIFTNYSTGGIAYGVTGFVENY